MTKTKVFNSGDTIDETAILWEDKAANKVFQIPNDATVTAYITNPKRQKIIIPAVAINYTSSGNDWPFGKIRIVIDKANTDVLSDYDGKQVCLIVKVLIGQDLRKFKRGVKAVKIP